MLIHRPLSLDTPKPLFRIAGRPIIWHGIQSLSRLEGLDEGQHTLECNAVLVLNFMQYSSLDSMKMQSSAHSLRKRLVTFQTSKSDICASFKL